VAFSFREVLGIHGIGKAELYSLYTMGKILHILSACLRKGFFPDIDLGNVDPSRVFRGYLDLVIYRDILERFGLRNRYALEYFIESCISSNASMYSVHKVYSSLGSRGFRVSKKTLYSFQKILEDVNFGVFLKKYDKSMGRMELSIPKFYLIDNGVYAYYEGENLGRLMENTVFLELLKAGFYPSQEVFYWKGLRGEGVDFVVRTAEGLKLIQATYASGWDEVDGRELESLVKASRALEARGPRGSNVEV
jgi:predicted AAA+ superfamily ATPase